MHTSDRGPDHDRSGLPATFTRMLTGNRLPAPGREESNELPD